jgi:predicted nucleic acid-binding protein
MNALDSSILVAALVESARHHAECRALLTAGPFALRAHGFVETFNTLTSGKIKPRPSAADVAKALRSSIRPRATLVHLSEDQLFQAFDQSEPRGVRGGTIFDYLHLVAARHRRADCFYTLNTSHFQSFWREGDPAIAHP